MDADLPRRGRRRRRDRVRAGREVGDEVFVVARGAGRAGARRGRRGARPLPGRRRSRASATSRRSTTSPTSARAATRCCSADFVTTEDGTGLVHTALAFGEDDFRLGEQYGMTLQNPVRPDGTFDERVPDFQGKLRLGRTTPRSSRRCASAAGCCAPRTTSTPTRTAGAAARRSSTTRSRAGTSRTTEVRDRMLAENERIGWHPEHIKHGRFGKWLEGNVDWALSRERYWGTPLPIWECEREDCEAALLRRLDRRPARARRRGPRRPAPSLHRRGRADCEQLRRGDAPGRRDDRRLVRLGRRCRSRSSTTRSRTSEEFERAVPGRLHLRGDRPDPRLVLLPARRVDPALRRSPATATASASA